jgi:hypothetical protein
MYALTLPSAPLTTHPPNHTRGPTHHTVRAYKLRAAALHSYSLSTFDLPRHDSQPLMEERRIKPTRIARWSHLYSARRSGPIFTRARPAFPAPWQCRSRSLPFRSRRGPQTGKERHGETREGKKAVREESGKRGPGDLWDSLECRDRATAAVSLLAGMWSGGAERNIFCCAERMGGSIQASRGEGGA